MTVLRSENLSGALWETPWTLIDSSVHSKVIIIECSGLLWRCGRLLKVISIDYKRNIEPFCNMVQLQYTWMHRTIKTMDFFSIHYDMTTILGTYVVVFFTLITLKKIKEIKISLICMKMTSTQLQSDNPSS